MYLPSLQLLASVARLATRLPNYTLSIYATLT